ncbi:MAG: hypothetical protein H0X71_09235, partial [Rubrobacter sp.]|nr:hypothetical protein [Rubrobacter sp.]
MENAEITGLLLRARGLAVTRGVLASEVGQSFLDLLGLLAQERPDPVVVAGTFGRLWEELTVEGGDLLPDAWQSYLVGRLLEDENPFSLCAERGETAPAYLVEQVRRDLRTLRALFDLGAETMLGLVATAVPGAEEIWVPWRDPDRADVAGPGASPRWVLAGKIAATEDWRDLVETLAGHHAVHGAGIFGRY